MAWALVGAIRTVSQLTTANQSAHEGHAVALAERDAAALAVRVLALASDALLSGLARGARLAREGRLVNLELDSLDDTNVGRDTVADREGDEVAGEESVG